jgi:hypothetical protein
MAEVITTVQRCNHHQQRPQERLLRLAGTARDTIPCFVCRIKRSLGGAKTKASSFRRVRPGSVEPDKNDDAELRFREVFHKSCRDLNVANQCRCMSTTTFPLFILVSRERRAMDGPQRGAEVKLSKCIFTGV